MVSLIITVVAVIISGLVTYAAIFYGGETYNTKKADADGIAMASQAQHIRAAAQLYMTQEGQMPATVQDLVTRGYLKEPALAGVTWDLDGSFALTDGQVTDAQCLAFNRANNIDEIPDCSDARYLLASVCCTE